MRGTSKLLIKGGTVVNAERQQIADVYVQDGIISAVNPNIMVFYFIFSIIFFCYLSIIPCVFLLLSAF
jgi:hypothetical protein